MVRFAAALTATLSFVALAAGVAGGQQPVPTLSLSDSTPDPGQTVTLTVECGIAGLTDVAGIFGPLPPTAGTVTPQTYNDAGASAWPGQTATGRSGSVTFSAPGTYLLSVECFTASTSNSGNLVVTVSDPSATTTTTTTTTTPPTTSTNTTAAPPTAATSATSAVSPTAVATDPAALPGTGAEVSTPWVAAIIATVVGAALVIVTRRSRPRASS